MHKQVILSTDSPADMPGDMRRRLGVQVLPLYVNMQGLSLRDGVDVSPEDVFALFEREKSIPTTSAPSVGDCQAHFEAACAHGERAVVHFSISRGISVSYSNARIAAAEFEDIHVVDSESMCTGLSLQLLRAARLREDGMDAAAIAADLERWKKRVRVTVLLGSPAFLRRSGRCSAVAAMGANLLGIRPVVHMIDGEARVYKKLRGRDAHVKYIDEVLGQENFRFDREIAFLSHTGLKAEELYAAQEHVHSYRIFKEVRVCPAGSVTSTHIGDRCLALIFAEEG